MFSSNSLLFIIISFKEFSSLDISISSLINNNLLFVLFSINLLELFKDNSFEIDLLLLSEAFIILLLDILSNKFLIYLLFSFSIYFILSSFVIFFDLKKSSLNSYNLGYVFSILNCSLLSIVILFAVLDILFSSNELLIILLLLINSV